MKTFTIQIEAYKFAELTPKAQMEACDNYSFHGLNDNWYESTIEDAKNIGLKIDSFDLDRQDIKGSFLVQPYACAKDVVTNHGEMCETFKTAQAFLQDYSLLWVKYAKEDNHEEIEEGKEQEYEEQLADLEIDFERSLLEDYRIILQKEYDYLNSREYAEEQLMEDTMELWFDVDGKLLDLPNGTQEA